MKTRTYYYYDEQNDDFANNGIKYDRTPEDYEYLPKNPFYRILKPLVYCVVHAICTLLLKFIMRIPIENTHVLHEKRDLRRGYFIYANHTTSFIDAISAPVTTYPRPCYTVTSPAAISVKGITLLVRMLGALPVPYSLNQYRSFNKTVEKLYKKGAVIAIFPEAHIWPRYDKIREFPSVSFEYPVRLGAPCYVKTTVYRKKRNGKTKPVLIYDGPFYPDRSLSHSQAREELCRKVYETMKMHAEESSSPDIRYRYVKVDSPDEVRTEFEAE